MIEISKHIESLLLENDCVIVPRLGGFIAHYQAAQYVPEENLFLPPSRVIGFNPQLKLNDGLLVQSYMSIYGNSFPEAEKMIARKVDLMLQTLQENGIMELPNIGELRYNINDQILFTPFDNKLATPYLYGLDSFVIKPLSIVEEETVASTQVKKQPKIIPLKPLEEQNIEENSTHSLTPEVSSTPNTRKKTLVFQKTLSEVAAVAVVVIVFALSLFYTTPISNTEVYDGNYAQLIPSDIFKDFHKQSLAFTPLAGSQKTVEEQASVTVTDSQKIIAAIPVEKVKVETTHVAKEVQTINQLPYQSTETSVTPAKKVEVKSNVTKSISKRYHLIVASVDTRKAAESMADQLRKQGYSDAKTIIGNGKMRVSIASFASQSEASKKASELRNNRTCQGAWVLKK